MDEKIKIIKDIEKYIAFWFVTQEAITDYKAEVEEEIKERKRAYATAFYNAGYRKESDTAREILDEAKKWVKAHYKDKVTDSFGEREMLFMEAFGCLFEYLKEKYGVDLGE